MEKNRMKKKAKRTFFVLSYVIQYAATRKKNSHLNEANMLLNSMLIAADYFHQ